MLIYALIPLLPLGAALTLALFGRRLQGAGHRIVIAAVAGSFLVSIAAFMDVLAHGAIEVPLYRLLEVGRLVVDLGFFIDPLTVLLLLLVTGLGFGLALANGLVRDVSNALSVALGLFFFLVPVVIAAPAGWLTDLNPVAAIIVAAHDLVVVGHLTRPLAFAGACMVSLLVLPAGWWRFRAAESLVAERI